MPLRSDLVCTKCRISVHECECPDQDERLRDLAYDPTADVMFRWCRNCDKHFARCRCEEFDDYVICGGKEIDPTTLKDFTGRPPTINLLHR